MSKILHSRVTVIICRIALAAIFIYAAAGKIQNPEDFAKHVAGFRILPFAGVNVFAIVLPWVEMLCGISLLSGIFVRSSALLLGLFNVMFIVAAAAAMARGLNIECGCFSLSNAGEKVGWALIARDTLFLLLSIPIIWQRDRKKG